MNTEHLRNFKHELRTPVSHILGYSELLLETATDAGHQAIVSQAKSIQSRGQTLARVLEKHLMFPKDGDMAKASGTLCTDLRPVIEQILEVSSPPSESLGTYNDDLERIRKAAERLLTLVDRTARSRIEAVS